MVQIPLRGSCPKLPPVRSGAAVVVLDGDVWLGGRGWTGDDRRTRYPAIAPTRRLGPQKRGKRCSCSLTFNSLDLARAKAGVRPLVLGAGDARRSHRTLDVDDRGARGGATLARGESLGGGCRRHDCGPVCACACGGGRNVGNLLLAARSSVHLAFLSKKRSTMLVCPCRANGAIGPCRHPLTTLPLPAARRPAIRASGLAGGEPNPPGGKAGFPGKSGAATPATRAPPSRHRYAAGGAELRQLLAVSRTRQFCSSRRPLEGRAAGWRTGQV
jgi:hypothetical protein